MSNVIKHNKNAEVQTNWQLILNQDITSDSYGAVVNFQNKELLNKEQKQIMSILKSIDINKP